MRRSPARAGFAVFAVVVLAAAAGCSNEGSGSAGPSSAGGSGPASELTGPEPIPPVMTDPPVASVAPGPTRFTSPPVVTAAPSAQALATRLVEAETAIRNPATRVGARRALGESQSDAYRAMVFNPDWIPEVLALVPAPVRAIVEANLAAGRDLKALTGDVDPNRPLPKWRIVAPEPADQLVALYKAAGQAAGGVPWEFLAAIHLVETRMGRIQGNSTAGAQGPMQFIPSTWAVYGRGGDISSNRDAIPAAARYLRARGAPADMDRALFSYNNSRRYVRAITAYAQQIRADERAYLGYHAWPVYYGTRLLAEGTVT